MPLVVRPLVVRPLVVPLPLVAWLPVVMPLLPLLVMPLLLPLGMVPPLGLMVPLPLLVMPLVLLPLGMVPPSGLMVPLALASLRREPFMPDESALIPESAVVPLLPAPVASELVPLEPQALSRVVLRPGRLKKRRFFWLSSWQTEIVGRVSIRILSWCQSPN